MSDNTESDNYYRLITLVVKTGTRTIREVFKKHTAGNMDSVLNTHGKKIEELRRKRVLTYPQYLLLNADIPDLEQLDISLLVKMIMHICTSVERPPGNGWRSNDVPSSDTTVGGYIIRIRNVRNKIVAHSTDTRVSNDLFKKYWEEGVKCLKELAAHVGTTLTDEITEEIQKTESMLLTADSNTELEATLAKWGVEESYTELAQLNEKADKLAYDLQRVMNDVTFLREQTAGDQHTGNRGLANQQIVSVDNNYISNVNIEVNQTKEVLEKRYDGVCKILRINTTHQQQTKALQPIVNPNALTEKEIVKYSKEIGMNWQIFAVHLGYKMHQTNQLITTYPKQMRTLLWTMLQQWHDVVARCENENPRKLLAASFACQNDFRTAFDIIGDWSLLEGVENMKPSPETTKKIEDIDFDEPFAQNTTNMVISLGPCFERSNLTVMAQEQQPGTSSDD